MFGCGCSVVNVFKGPVDYHRNYMADDFICLVDEGVISERDKKLPNGWLTRPYDPEYWQVYWNGWMYQILKDALAETFEGYRGPSEKTLVLYALQQRREAGLADIVLDPRNADKIPALYAELDDIGKSSCDILNWQSPVCDLSPAQYPGSPSFQRECKTVPE